MRSGGIYAAPCARAYTRRTGRTQPILAAPPLPSLHFSLFLTSFYYIFPLPSSLLCLSTSSLAVLCHYTPHHHDSTRNRKSAVADTMEVENKQMSDRLQQLKLTLKKQKAQRGGKAKGVIWRSAAAPKSSGKLLEKGGGGRRRPARPPNGSGGRRSAKAGEQPNNAGAASNRRITAAQIAPHPPSRMPTFKAAPPPPQAADGRPASASVNDPADMLELKGAESDVTPEEQSGSGEEFDEDAGHAGFLAALNEWRGGGSPSKAAAAASVPSASAASSASSASTSHPTAVAGCPNRSNAYHTCSAFCSSLVAKDGAVAEGPAPRPAAQAAGSSSTYDVGGSVSGGTGTGTAGGLADGEYDEAASAAAFRAAVAEWRTGNPAAPAAAPAAGRSRGMWMAPADVAEVQSFECQTEPTAPKPKANTEIKFKTTTGLTYMEKLLLAKLRQQGPAAVAAENVPLRRDSAAAAAAGEPGGATALQASATAPAAHDPDGWLEPLPAHGAADELANSSGRGGLQISEVFSDDSGASDDGAATPCVVDEPSSDEGGGGGGAIDYTATEPAVQYDSRPLTASRKITITPEYPHISNGSSAADDELELEEITIEEYFEEEEDAGAAAAASVATPTRPTQAGDLDATPTGAARAAAAPTASSSLATAVVSASEEGDSSSDSEADEMAAAAMAAMLSAEVESAALDSFENSANGLELGAGSSPRRSIITPGMMHDFEEMEEKIALI